MNTDAHGFELARSVFISVHRSVSPYLTTAADTLNQLDLQNDQVNAYIMKTNFTIRVRNVYGR